MRNVDWGILVARPRAPISILKREERSRIQWSDVRRPRWRKVGDNSKNANICSPTILPVQSRELIDLSLLRPRSYQ
jgi:hypothetical protein